MISDNTFGDICKVIHRLKGSMPYFAPVECKEIILNLEQLLNSESYFKFIDNFEIFKDAHDILIRELKNVYRKL